MTTGEARYVWEHRHEHPKKTVGYAVMILEEEGEM